MKTMPAVLLLIVFLHASLTLAADGDLKAAFDTLQQRHAEAITTATVETTGTVEDAWFLDLKKLRLDAVAKGDTQTAKKIEAMLLAAGRNGVSLPAAAAPVASVPEEKNMGLPEKGSQWNGYKTTEPENKYLNVNATITSVGENSLVLRVSHDDGAVWEWTLKHADEGFKVINLTRVRIADWNKTAQPGPVLGISGMAQINNATITLNYRWPDSERPWSGAYKLKLVK